MDIGRSQKLTMSTSCSGELKIARNEPLLLFPWYFLPVWRTFCHFYQIRVCCLQNLSVRKSLKFVVCETVHMKSVKTKQKVWAHINLQGLCRLTLIDMFCKCIKSLPNDKILDWSKLKASALQMTKYISITTGAWAPVSLHRPDFSVTMKTRF